MTDGNEPLIASENMNNIYLVVVWCWYVFVGITVLTMDDRIRNTER